MNDGLKIGRTLQHWKDRWVVRTVTEDAVEERTFASLSAARDYFDCMENRDAATRLRAADFAGLLGRTEVRQ